MSRPPRAPRAEESDKPLRADARRNRERVLAVARKLFETEGVTGEMDEVARRAGVGVGTVYRHFPTKEALIRGVAEGYVEYLLEAARTRSDAADPGAAFFEYLAILANELAAKRSLLHATAGADPGSEDLAARRAAFHDAIGALLVRAQRAGAVRPDVTAVDVINLIRGPLFSADSDADARRRLLDVVCEGLRSRST